MKERLATDSVYTRVKKKVDIVPACTRVKRVGTVCKGDNKVKCVRFTQEKKKKKRRHMSGLNEN